MILYVTLNKKSIGEIPVAWRRGGLYDKGNGEGREKESPSLFRAGSP